MKKEDLKTGMLVELRNGNVYMIINDFIVRGCGFNSIVSYNDYLTIISNDKEWDIVKVSNISEGYLLEPKYWTAETLNDNLLWERKEVPEYVELLRSQNGYEKGDIAKVICVMHGDGYNVSVPNRKSDSVYAPNVFYSSVRTKPSTKEAYEAQFKVNEMTIEEIEKALNINNLKIKK